MNKKILRAVVNEYAYEQELMRRYQTEVLDEAYFNHMISHLDEPERPLTADADTDELGRTPDEKVAYAAYTRRTPEGDAIIHRREEFDCASWVGLPAYRIIIYSYSSSSMNSAIESV